MKQLLSSSIAAPGFYGLNSQESSVTLSSGYALQSDNCVIDSGGRLGARKGYIYKTSTGGTGSNIEGIHDFVGPTGHIDYVSWGNNNIYKGISTLTSLSMPSGYTISGDEWAAASLGGNLYMVQDGHTPLKISSSLVVSEHNQGGGGAHSLPDVSWITTAFGRLFAAGETGNHHDLHVSDSSGDFSEGSIDGAVLDFNTIWTNGGDELISAHGFNGRLVVFSKRCIVILDDSNNTDLEFSTTDANLRVVEIIENVGCVSRKSIQIVGDDIYFLSNTGLRSLNRVIQEKSNPLSDLSINVRDELVDLINTTTHQEITSVYSAANAFYLIIFPTAKLVYCFDTRGKLENGGLRATKWVDVPFLSSLSAYNGDLYVGLKNGIGEYTGYQDNGSSYYMAYKTNYFDFDQPTTTKILKTVGVTVIGGSGQNFTVKSGTDYTDQPRSYNRSIKQSAVSEYDVDEYGPSTSGDSYTYEALDGTSHTVDTVAGTAKFTGGGSTDRIKVAIGGQGSVLQLGFEAYIDGDELSIQKFDVYVKQGRTN